MNKLYVKSGLIALFMGASFASYSQTINTIAGDSAVGYSGDGGLATDAELNGPAGIAEDASGNIYIADQNNNCIRMVNTSGIITTIAGNTVAGYDGDGGAATAAELNNPYGITLDNSGTLYIADYINNRVRVINTSGIINTFAGNGFGAPSSGGFSGDGGQATDAELYLPSDVKADNTGNVYIADEVNDRIRMVNTSGIINTVVGDSGQGYSGDGGPATDAELYFPAGIGLDGIGNIYIADQRNNCIRKVNSSGTISTFAGNTSLGFYGDGGPATAAEMIFPYGVVADASGSVFVSDAGNSRIRVITASDTIHTIAGRNSSGYSGDGGPPNAAELNNPLGILLDASGNFYIADAANNRVREIGSLIATGVNKAAISSNDLNIFPVPNSGVFTVTGVSKGQVIELYNYLGQKVYTSTQSPSNGGSASFARQINISPLPNGIYLIRILNKDGNIAAEKKIVKTE